MLLRKTHTYRLYPNQDQAATLGRWVGAVRATYNVALEQRRVFGRQGRRFNFASQCREVTALRAEFDWLRDVPVHPLQQAIKDLDQAYRNWWSGRAHAPQPRKRSVNDTMRFPDPATFAVRRLSRRTGEVKLPRLGRVRLRWDRAVPGTIKNLTVSRASGRWHVSAQYEDEVPDQEPSVLPAVGIDRGISVFAALSDGTLIEPADVGRKAKWSLARAQRRLSRKRRGSNNRRKAASKVRRLQARIARRRKDYLHKLSHKIVKNHGVVVLERLTVRNMVRSARGTEERHGRNVRAKAALNRSILDQGWGMFRSMLSRKLFETGGRLVEVEARNTSITCSTCNAVDSGSRREQRFCCTSCGYKVHADYNAAINIYRRWDTPSLPSEASRERASEQGTVRTV